MTDFESQRIKGVLKTLLKRKNITYEDLSQQLGCSVPTVTRILGAEELTLTRLLQLCQILEVDLADIQNLISNEEEPKESFTPEQESFLVNNRHFLSYLIRLFDNESPKQIAERNKLTPRSTDKYLIGLEKQNLIRVTGKQKLKTTFKALPMFGKGPLGKAYYESIVRNAATFFIRKISEDIAQSKPESSEIKTTMSVSTQKMTKETYTAWISEREKLDRAFRKLASFEKKTKDSSELLTAVTIDATALVPTEYPGLQIVENTFGEIPNI